MILSAEFAWRVRKSPQLNERFAGLRSSRIWKGFLGGKCPAVNLEDARRLTCPSGLIVATLTIFIRCVFRVAELSEGFNGTLFNDEVAFMILEGYVSSEDL